ELLWSSVHCAPGQYIARSTAIGTSALIATDTSVFLTPRFQGVLGSFKFASFTMIVRRLEAGTVTFWITIAPPDIRYRNVICASRTCGLPSRMNSKKNKLD